MKTTKTIGLLYLTIAIIGGFSMGYAPITLINIDNLAQTFNNIQENFTLYKFSVIGDGIVIILELFITILLFQFFEKTDTVWSQIAKVSRLSMTFIMAINIVNYILPLHNINNATHPTELFNICIQMHFYTVYIWQVFFGIHMIALSVLTCKHSKFSKTLSLLLLMGGIGYLQDSVIYLFGVNSPNFSVFSNVLLGVAAVSELSFAILLLTKKMQD